MHIGLPAHEIIKARRDDLLVDQRGKERDDEAHDADEREHHEEFRPVRGKKPAPPLARLHGRQHVDEPADEPERRRLDPRRDAAEHQERGERRLGLPDIEPDEGEQLPRRPQVVPPREGLYPVLEEGEKRPEDHAPDIGRFERRAN